NRAASSRSRAFSASSASRLARRASIASRSLRYAIRSNVSSIAMKSIVFLIALLAAPVAQAKPFVPTAFTVEVAGKGRPIILIPGLGCPGSVWADTVAHFSGAQTHVLTLAGFAGVTPIDKPLSATARAELAAYIRDRKLD